MSQALVDEKIEPVEVSNKYDASQLKNAVDDELARYYSKTEKYVQSHVHTDVKLLLGYVSCFIAFGAFLYEYKTNFNEALNVSIACATVYWALQAIAFVYSYKVEKDEVFVGNQKENGKVTGSLVICGKMEKHSPIYKLTFIYTDKATGKKSVQKVEPNISSWFNTNNALETSAINRDLSGYLKTVKQKLHAQ